MTAVHVGFEYKPRDPILLRPLAQVAGVALSDVDIRNEPKRRHLREKSLG